MFLYGKHSVYERLKVNPGSIKKIYLQSDFSAPHIEKLINTQDITVERLSSKALRKIKPTDSLGGIIAKVDKFAYTPFESLIPRPRDISLIFLDRVFDPRNLGSIIRTAACFGGFALVIPKHKACEVTEAVLHVASGGENFVPVSMVSNSTQALLKAKECGFWAVGAVVSGGREIQEADFSLPLCLILGSEGKGIRYGIDKHLDFKVRIPMGGISLSLNVSIAAAVFCYEIARRRVLKSG